MTTNDRCTHLVLIRRLAGKEFARHKEIAKGLQRLTDEMLAGIEWKLNHRPRKSLGYRTPLEYCKPLFKYDF